MNDEVRVEAGGGIRMDRQGNVVVQVCCVELTRLRKIEQAVAALLSRPDLHPAVQRHLDGLIEAFGDTSGDSTGEQT